RSTRALGPMDSSSGPFGDADTRAVVEAVSRERNMTAMELDLESSLANLLVLADRIERGEPIPRPVVHVAPEPEPVVAPEIVVDEPAVVAHDDITVDDAEETRVVDELGVSDVVADEPASVE